MKKLFILFLLTFIGSIKGNASSWYFTWDEATTTIEVPLGANLQNYIHIPKALLYQDGSLMEDAEIQYITTGDWLYLLTDVDTMRVGDYQVWYKAIENKYKPGQCQGYKALVTFRVVDKEKPVFRELPTKIKYYMGAEKPDYLSKVTASDNSGNCSLTYDDSLVQYDTPGVYMVFLQASDGVNITIEELEVEVEDLKGPAITFLGENHRILLEKGERVELQKYFKAIDKVDGDVTSSISYSPFDTNVARIFDLIVSFYDRSMNRSEITIRVEIVNKDEPVIELYKSILIIEYKTDFQKAILENLKSAFLGKEDITKDIIIDSTTVKNEVGSYMVSYTYSNEDKFLKQECEVKILSLYPPSLFVQNISASIGQRVDILAYVQVEDSSDSHIQEKIEFDDSLVDYSKEGVYPVRISVTNSSNLSTSETLYLTIYSLDSIETEKNWFFIPILLVGVGLIGAIGIGFYLYKKRRNCNKSENNL